MTKAELVIKFSNTVGVSETDAKVFYEILLKRLAALLKSSQSIFIPEFGYFHLIKGKIKKPALDINDNEFSEEFIDLILYSEDEKLSQSETKGFVFNIPFMDEDDYDSVDSYFSLSIGKPVIPLRGVLADKTYMPVSGYDYRKFLESKAEEIITRSKIITPDEQFPTLIIDASSYNSNQVHLEQSEDTLTSLLADEQELDEQTINKEDKNVVKNIAWDFGDFLTKKISAESILDITDERINIHPPDNSNKSETEKELDITNDEEDILDKLLENGKENIPEILPDEKVSDNNFPDESSVKLESAESENLLDELNDFEEVKSELPDSINLDDNISDEEFWKSTSKLFETYNPRELRSGDSNDFTEVKSTASDMEDLSSRKSKIELAPETENEKNNEEEYKQEEIEESLKTENEIEELPLVEDILPEGKKSKVWAILVFSVLLILVVAAIYWYLQINQKGIDNIQVKESSLKTDNTNFVERDFQIPITFPYLPEKSAKDIILMDKGNNDIEKESEINSQKPEIKTDKLQAETSLPDNNLIPKGNPVSVGNNIYKYGNVYVVQVASFKSNSIAENEAGRYRNKGFNAFVEPVEISGKGLWYRIKVGNFSSVDEAKNFIANNIR
jgi:hypothetical protein